MKRVPVAAGVLLGGFAGWTVAASFLFVQFGGLGGKLDQPWLAWWLYAVSSPDGWTVALLAASAALPLVWPLASLSRRGSSPGDSTAASSRSTAPVRGPQKLRC